MLGRNISWNSARNLLLLTVLAVLPPASAETLWTNALLPMATQASTRRRCMKRVRYQHKYVSGGDN